MGDEDVNAVLSTLMTQYCRTIDAENYEGLAEIWWDDATLIVGDIRITGRDRIVRAIQRTHSQAGPGRHHFANVRLVVEGDYASAHCDFLYFGPDRLLQQAGTYVDAFRRLSGEWRFISREILVDFS